MQSVTICTRPACSQIALPAASGMRGAAVSVKPDIVSG